MSTSSNIEWTDATWNPSVGCSVISPGCKHCYAMKMAARIERMGTAPHYAGLTHRTKEGAVWTGVVRDAPDHIIQQPWRWSKPRRIFVNSMSDLFHEQASEHARLTVISAAWGNPRHTFQVLTKRSEIMRDWMTQRCPEPPANLWLGVSVEDRERKFRIDHLRNTPAAVRFVSAEPLLCHLGEIDLAGIHWLIAGCESGPGARRCSLDAVRSLRDQCAAQGVAFFFKQWAEGGRVVSLPLLDGVQHATFPEAPHA